EEEQVREQAQRVREQLEASYHDAGARGHVVALPPTQAYVSWDDLEPRTGAAPRLEELSLDDSTPNPVSGIPDGVRHVRCQPAMEFHSRVTDWIGDIR